MTEARTMQFVIERASTGDVRKWMPFPIWVHFPPEKNVCYPGCRRCKHVYVVTDESVREVVAITGKQPLPRPVVCECIGFLCE